MNPLDILVLLPIGAWLVYSLRRMRRVRKSGGGCHGDCGHCGGCHR